MQLAQIGGTPDRIAAQIVTGMGFLGGGAILRSGTSVKGMTTAATIWVNAAIGMAAGAGEYALATIATASPSWCSPCSRRSKRSSNGARAAPISTITPRDSVVSQKFVCAAPSLEPIRQLRLRVIVSRGVKWLYIRLR